MKNKILTIGIDGGTWTILKPAIDKGYMPFLEMLTRTGAHGVLESVIPAITPAAWGSFQTGKNPGQNGVYNFYKWDNQTHKDYLVSSSDLKNTIWEIATQAGKTVGTLNVPMTYPPKNNSGDIVSGVLTPSIESNFTWPPELKTEILNHVPDYEILNLEKVYISPSETDVTSFVSIMRKNLEWRFKVADFLLKRKSYDLFMVHFHASDIIQHGLWCFMDDKHPLFDEKKQKYIFREFYGYLDDLIKKTVEIVPPQDCFIISDHGFQSHLYDFNIASWLLENNYIDNGYLEYHRSLSRTSSAPQAKSWIKKAKTLGIGKILRKAIPKSLVEKIELKTKLKNLSHTYKFNNNIKCSASGRECFIYILDCKNKDTILKSLLTQLSTVMDKNNKPIFKYIYKKEEIFHGERLDKMPDLTLVPSDNWAIAFNVKAIDEKVINIELGNTFHMGTHHPDGIFIAFGSNIKHMPFGKYSILDIAPTILWMLDIETDIQFDGRIITEVWKDEYINNKKITAKTKIKTESQQNNSNSVYNKQDNNTVEKRLKDLGYF